MQSKCCFSIHKKIIFYVTISSRKKAKTNVQSNVFFITFILIQINFRFTMII